MKRALALTVFIAAAVPALAEDAPPVLTMDGIGSLKVGMAVDKLEQLLHTRIAYSKFNNNGCSVLTTATLEPRGISLMIDEKLLARVNVEFVGTSALPKTVKTEAGIGLGSSEDDLKKAYPTAKVKPNPADPSWHTISVLNADGSQGFVFETDGVTVKSMRSGITPAISFQRGCD